jgi:hypothetical protein
MEDTTEYNAVTSFDLPVVVEDADTATQSTLVFHARQLVVVECKQARMKVGVDMDRVDVVVGGSMVIGLNGTIVAVGTTAHVMELHQHDTFLHVVDARNKCILPGFVDGHTHPVWSGDRVHEFAMKLAGATYMEIHAKGGGIGYTVEHTRQSTEDELLGLFMSRLNRMLKFGTYVYARCCWLLSQLLLCQCWLSGLTHLLSSLVLVACVHIYIYVYMCVCVCALASTHRTVVEAKSGM